MFDSYGLDRVRDGIGCRCPSFWHGVVPPLCPVHNPHGTANTSKLNEAYSVGRDVGLREGRESLLREQLNARDQTTPDPLSGVEHEEWCFRRHTGNCVDGPSEAVPTPDPTDGLREHVGSPSGFAAYPLNQPKPVGGSWETTSHDAGCCASRGCHKVCSHLCGTSLHVCDGTTHLSGHVSPIEFPFAFVSHPTDPTITEIASRAIVRDAFEQGRRFERSFPNALEVERLERALDEALTSMNAVLEYRGYDGGPTRGELAIAVLVAIENEKVHSDT